MGVAPQKYYRGDGQCFAHYVLLFITRHKGITVVVKCVRRSISVVRTAGNVSEPTACDAAVENHAPCHRLKEKDVVVVNWTDSLRQVVVPRIREIGHG